MGKKTRDYSRIAKRQYAFIAVCKVALTIFSLLVPFSLIAYKVKFQLGFVNNLYLAITDIYAQAAFLLSLLIICLISIYYKLRYLRTVRLARASGWRGLYKSMVVSYLFLLGSLLFQNRNLPEIIVTVVIVLLIWGISAITLQVNIYPSDSEYIYGKLIEQDSSDIMQAYECEQCHKVFISEDESDICSHIHDAFYLGDSCVSYRIAGENKSIRVRRDFSYCDCYYVERNAEGEIINVTKYDESNEDELDVAPYPYGELTTYHEGLDYYLSKKNVPISTANPTPSSRRVKSTSNSSIKTTKRLNTENLTIVEGHVADGLYTSLAEAKAYGKFVITTYENTTAYRCLPVQFSDGSTKYTVEWY